MSMILVTGATGAVGSHVVRELSNRGEAVRALVRDPARAPAGVEAVVGDLADPASVRLALDGVDRVFLCCGNGPAQVDHETTVIDAAAAAGVRRLVKLGAEGARIGSPVHFWDTHGRIERHLRASGLASVVLRPTTYLSNLLAHAASVREHGTVFAPAGDAKVAMIDPRDVAEVAAVALTEDGHDGRTYTLTGPAALTHHEVADELSTVAGRPVGYVNVPDPVARQGMVDAGLPEWLAGQIVILWGELRGGAAEATTDVVRVLTGREPRTLAGFLRDHAAAWVTNR
jgi:uncharacterized protein YbjT (DUF2867 family)